jgi:dienelactone hydrolase
MQVRRSGWGGIAWAVAVALGVIGAGALRAQNPPAGKKAAGKVPSKLRNQGGVPLKKALPNAADPLAKPQEKEKAEPAGSFHYRFKLIVFDGTALMTKYYPSRLGTTAPVILMVHEKDRSGKDFEDPILDLKGRGLAEHLQGQGYAVLIPDLRGQGTNQRRALSPKDWRQMVDDLQAAYHFLIDRHNRGELNLSKLGVLGVGEGANLASAWLSTSGGAVASEGRLSDASALALISPMAEGEGLRLGPVMAQLANRFPIQIIVGEHDPVSGDPVRAVQPIVKRSPQNKVEFKDSQFHGYKLLKLDPQVTSDLTKFFEGTIKYKAGEWEPRYNLNPVAYSDIEVVRHAKSQEGEPAKEAAPARKEAEPKAKAEAAAKKGEGK